LCRFVVFIIVAFPAITTTDDDDYNMKAQKAHRHDDEARNSVCVTAAAAKHLMAGR